MAWLIVSDGTIGRWQIFESEEEALRALEKEEMRYRNWLEKQEKGLVFYPWTKSLLIKIGDIVKIKTQTSTPKASQDE